MSSNSQNKFGFVRLALATLVVVSHSPELIDGNRSREILSQIFNTLSFGELAVDGFFLVSGYLITKSCLISPNSMNYILKRTIRIFPGFVVAYLISLIVVGALAGGNLAPLATPLGLAKAMFRLVFLQPPELQGAFSGLPYSILNGSMWTIIYEFRCYVFLLVLRAVGILQYRTVILVLALIGLALSAAIPSWSLPPPLMIFLGNPVARMRFTSVFLVGSSFYLFRDAISLRGEAALVAAILLIPLLFIRSVAEPALAVLGGYILFWFIFSSKLNMLGRIGSNTDISYGLYLYAWPVQNLIIMYWREVSPLILFALTMLIAGALGYLSWVLVEKPFLALKPKGYPRMAPHVTYPHPAPPVS